MRNPAFKLFVFFLNRKQYTLFNNHFIRSPALPELGFQFIRKTMELRGALSICEFGFVGEAAHADFFSRNETFSNAIYVYFYIVSLASARVINLDLGLHNFLIKFVTGFVTLFRKGRYTKADIAQLVEQLIRNE